MTNLIKAGGAVFAAMSSSDTEAISSIGETFDGFWSFVTSNPMIAIIICMPIVIGASMLLVRWIRRASR